MSVFKIDSQFNNALRGGAFLVAGDATPNPMTIGWGAIGTLWGKRTFFAPVRDSRFTREKIEDGGCFTVSFPKNDGFKRALAICGKMSGRDGDKWSAAGITPARAKIVATAYVDGCDVCECKLLAAIPMPLDLIPPNLCKQFYKNGDKHTLFIGEILS
jgi:flavin reductase (DIM6/NTAB) family NADH-FMN oxidoreductase RutF